MLKNNGAFNTNIKITMSSLFVLLFFLASMNFLNQYYFLLNGAICIFLLSSPNIKVDLNFLMLTSLSVSLLLFSPLHYNIATAFLFPLVYCAGLNFFKICGNESYKVAEKTFLKTVVILSIAPFCHYVLNWIYNLNNASGRNTIDIWTRTVSSATLQSILGCMMVGVAIGYFFSNDSIKDKVLSTATIVIIMLYNMILGGRTLIVLTVLSTFFSFCFASSKQKNKKETIKIIEFILMIFILITIIWKYNLFGIKSWIESSNLFYRFTDGLSIDLLQDTRWTKKFDYFKNFSKGFWGGQTLKESGIGYAHDIILDTYDEAGIIAFIAISVFIVSSIKLFMKVIKDEDYCLKTRRIIFSLYVTVLMVFFIEPILQGAPWLFANFCFIHGLLTGLNRIKKEKVYERRVLLNKHHAEK